MDRRRTLGVASLTAAGLLALGSLAACGSSDNGGSGGGGGGSSSSADVGVILPDATTSPRWEGQDRPNLQKAFQAAGLKADIQNAGGSTAKFGELCDTMINEGVKVIMITNLDSESGGACLKKAADAGVQSIDYDRLTLGGGASYYVSFDNVKVGELMGQGLQQCLTDMGKKSANIVYVDGAATDNNSALFKQGYAQALKPKLSSGDYHLVGDQSGNWDATTAGQVFDQMYTQNNGKIDGIISANDTMAGGIIARLKADGQAGKIPVTGQDAGTEGLQNILQGYQCGTVYKNTTLEAKAASDLAIDLIKGDKAAADKLATGKVEDTKLKKEIPSVLATPVWVTKDNAKQVVQDKQADASQVCKGAVAKLCTKYGLR
ncbi:sugar ABC transporter substrate-binding protein [Nocardioides sp. DS6]|uniref:Sugar ABC transporter substrate-binding protein n=1 Tax=Nocardioides eburneus TaxID=3231482 RepID=A0ABV3SXK3_9ACTN